MSEAGRVAVGRPLLSEVNPQRVALLANLSRAASLFVVVVGCLVLLGWQLDIEQLKSLLPGCVAMNPMTALGLILAASSLWTLQGPYSRARQAHWFRRTTQVGASLVVALGLVTLIGYALGGNLGPDQILFREQLGANQIAPNTGFNFLLVGIALLLLYWENPVRGAPGSGRRALPHRDRSDVRARVRVRSGRTLRRRRLYPHGVADRDRVSRARRWDRVCAT